MSGDGALLVGRYRVLRRLGSGGMGTVLLCRDERLHREVAVKRLHSASPKEIEYRFVREARLGASLNHPHLVTVFDTLTDDEGVLIVMEYVDGEALSGAIKRGPLPARQVTRLATEVGSALDYAHDNGVVHRDVKPPNVLLRGDGSALLADLGIATAADETRITRSGTVLGSAAYMAPEQLDGHRAGPAADVYALGAVLFEALTGTRARKGRTPMEIVQDANGKPPPDLREHLPTAPAAAADVLRRALDRDPAQRPHSAGELASTLVAALGQPESAARTKRMARTESIGVQPRHGPRPVPRSATPAPDGGRGLAVPAAITALAVVTAGVGAVALVSQGDGGGDGGAGGSTAPAPRAAAGRPKEKSPKKKETPVVAAPTATPEPATPEAGASGSQLNAQGFELLKASRYDEAVPVLREAVAKWPEGSRDIEYAYALFNLGKALNRSGDPEAAIPYLERRLTFSDQRGTVQTELDEARRRAGTP